MTIELWHEWNSVHSFKVRTVLAEKRIEWADRRVELLAFEHLTAQYLRLNSDGVVPTLVHDGNVIVESSVICQYLEETFPDPPLMPADALGRARVRAWMKRFDDVAHPAIRRASFELLYRPLLRSMPPAELEARLASHPNPARAQAFRDAIEGSPDPTAVIAARATLGELFARIDRALASGGPWLCGASFTLADVAMAPLVERVEHLAMMDLLVGRVAEWGGRVLARPSVVAAKAPDRYRFPLPAPAA